MIEWASELIGKLFGYALGLVGVFASLSMLIAVLREWSGEEGSIAKAWKKIAFGILAIFLTPSIIALLTYLAKSLAVVRLGW